MKRFSKGDNNSQGKEDEGEDVEKFPDLSSISPLLDALLDGPPPRESDAWDSL